MSLIACVDGELVVSTEMDDSQWNALATIAKAQPERVAYPSGARVFCRRSSRGLPHFVSREKNAHGATAPTSLQHELIKALVVKSMVAAGWTDVQPERPFTDAGRVADVYGIAPSGSEVVVEVQLSRQPQHVYQERTDDYARAGATTIWVTPQVTEVPDGVLAVWTPVSKNDDAYRRVEDVARAGAALYLDGLFSTPESRLNEVLSAVCEGATVVSPRVAVLSFTQAQCTWCYRWSTTWSVAGSSAPAMSGRALDTRRLTVPGDLLKPWLAAAAGVTELPLAQEGNSGLLHCPACRTVIGNCNSYSRGITSPSPRLLLWTDIVVDAGKNWSGLRPRGNVCLDEHAATSTPPKQASTLNWNPLRKAAGPAEPKKDASTVFPIDDALARYRETAAAARNLVDSEQCESPRDREARVAAERQEMLDKEAASAALAAQVATVAYESITDLVTGQLRVAGMIMVGFVDRGDTRTSIVTRAQTGTQVHWCVHKHGPPQGKRRASAVHIYLRDAAVCWEVANIGPTTKREIQPVLDWLGDGGEVKTAQ